LARLFALEGPGKNVRRAHRPLASLAVLPVARLVSPRPARFVVVAVVAAVTTIIIGIAVGERCARVRVRTPWTRTM
jgi:hypothetical protein